MLLAVPILAQEVPNTGNIDSVKTYDLSYEGNIT